MFISSVFLAGALLGMMGTVVGMIAGGYALAKLNRRGGRWSEKKFEVDCLIPSLIMLAVAVIVLWIFWPITAPWQIAVVAFAVSGFAGRWLGIAPAEHLADSEGLAALLLFVIPVTVVSLLTGIANHFWWQVV